jgi:AAA+ ATPase superfamily predicted ATPase
VILEQIVIDILKEEIPKIEKNVKWDGMYDNIATKVVKSIKEEIVKY